MKMGTPIVAMKMPPIIRVCAPNPIRDVPMLIVTHARMIGYYRLMDTWKGPAKSRRRLSWSAHDVGTYRPWTGEKVS